MYMKVHILLLWAFLMLSSSLSFSQNPLKDGKPIQETTEIDPTSNSSNPKRLDGFKLGELTGQVLAIVIGVGALLYFDRKKRIKAKQKQAEIQNERKG